MSYCECPIAGFCSKHGISKTKREFELCQGVNCDPATSQKYRDAWDAGTLFGQEKAGSIPCAGCNNGKVVQQSSNQLTVAKRSGVAAGRTETHSVLARKSLLSELTPADIPCQFRGEYLRDGKCKPCKGGVAVPVYQCNLVSNTRHECTLLSGRLDGIRGCTKCEHGMDAYEDWIDRIGLKKKQAIQTTTVTHFDHPETLVSNNHRVAVKRKKSWSKSFNHVCVSVGAETDNDCVFHCTNTQHDLCVLTKADLSGLESAIQDRCTVCNSCHHKKLVPRFITTAQLSKDVHELAKRLPSDVTAVAGVARSGLHSATMISMLLHLPLFSVRQSQKDIIAAGSGWRMSEGTKDPKSGTVVVVDDTVMTGNSLRDISTLIRNSFDSVITAAIYVNPLAVQKPDIWAVDLPWPHYLEWNLFNSVILPSAAFDFDGIICEDCPPGSDDDGPKYLEFIRNTRPNYVTRKAPIPLIVTARLEKYRSETEAWLAKWGIRCNELVMAPHTKLRDRQKENMAAFKAHHFAKFAKHARGIKPPVFIESDVNQAREISRLAKGVTICPAAGRCFRNGK